MGSDIIERKDANGRLRTRPLRESRIYPSDPMKKKRAQKGRSSDKGQNLSNLSENEVNGTVERPPKRRIYPKRKNGGAPDP